MKQYTQTLRTTHWESLVEKRINEGESREEGGPQTVLVIGLLRKGETDVGRRVCGGGKDWESCQSHSISGSGIEAIGSSEH